MAKNRTRKLRNHHARRNRLNDAKQAAQACKENLKFKRSKRHAEQAEPVFVTSKGARYFYCEDDPRVARIAEKNRVEAPLEELRQQFGDRQIAA
jgi:hypothetical protein